MNKTWQRVKWFPVLLALILSTSSGLWAQVSGKVKVAAIYTVPVEQQWVSRIHKALNAAKARGEIEYSFSENVANTDYERVMREYSEQGNHLLVGEVFGVERAARKVAKDSQAAQHKGGSIQAHKHIHRIHQGDLSDWADGGQARTWIIPEAGGLGSLRDTAFAPKRTSN